MTVRPTSDSWRIRKARRCCVYAWKRNITTRKIVTIPKSQKKFLANCSNKVDFEDFRGRIIKNLLIAPYQAIGLGAPQTIIKCVCVCHRGHYEALSRCRLVGSCVRPGENFFPAYGPRLHAWHSTGNHEVNSVFITIRSIRDTNYKFHFFFIFSKLFLYIITVSFAMVIKRSHGGESAGGGRSTSKSTCVVPAWTMTSENASFGVCASRRVIASTDLWPQV